MDPLPLSELLLPLRKYPLPLRKYPVPLIQFPLPLRLYSCRSISMSIHTQKEREGQTTSENETRKTETDRLPEAEGQTETDTHRQADKQRKTETKDMIRCGVFVFARTGIYPPM